jgi:hypothetical protein
MRGLSLPALAVLAILALQIGCRDRSKPAEPAPVALDRELASKLARLPLECLEREYPNKPGNVIESDAQVLPPRKLSPAFFGCFDWHSSVHGHWTLVRLLRVQSGEGSPAWGGGTPKGRGAPKGPDLPEAGAARALLDRHLAPAPLAAELEYVRAPRNRTFERPYGWGWLLRLAAEAHELGGESGRRWSAALAPLASFLGRAFEDYLSRLATPVRDGTHVNTAYAMIHALDYARAVDDRALATLLERRARELFAADRECPVQYEPSGEDFISPCLVEADLLRRVLPARALVAWLDAFLPAVGSERFKRFAVPPEVRDPKDYRIGHLIGLGLQRAASLEGIAGALPDGDPRRVEYRRVAAEHERAALRQLDAAGYGGAHWLASFIVYRLTRVGVESRASSQSPM